jgi:flagellar protein FliO/FliZ
MSATRPPSIPVLSAALILLLPPSVMAAELDGTAAMLRLTWGLLVVLGIMLILYALARKRFSLLQPPSGSAIRIVELRHLMPKKSLCLVEVKGQQFLLGLSSDRISLIAEISGERNETFAAVLEKSAARPTS